MHKVVVYPHVCLVTYDVPTGSIVLPHGARHSSVVAMDKSGSVEVRISREDDVVIKRDSKYSGRLLQVTDTVATILIGDDKLSVRNYDTVSYGVHVLESEGPFRVSMMVDGVSWSCMGVARLLEGDILSFTFKAVIKSKYPMEGDVTLVAGAPNTNEVVHERAMMRMVSSDDVVESDLEDYKEYDIGYTVMEETTVRELTSFDVQSSKFYKHKAGSSDVEFGYVFTVPSFMPQCRVSLYNDSLTSLIGMGSVLESQPGEDVDFTVGKSTIVRCTSTVERGERSDRITIDVESREYPLNLMVTHGISNRTISRMLPDLYHNVKNGILMIRLSVNEDSQEVITIEYK